LSENVHQRARELALARRIDEIGEAERRWMEAHLETCAECSAFSSALENAVGAVRMPAVTASSMLVRSTQARVRARALELNAHAAAMRPLWIGVAMVCVWATLTTPLIWAGFAWLGTAFELSRVEWRTMFVFTWMAPTLGASLVLLSSGWQRTQTAFAPRWEAR
jgi:hypothetical protein